MLDSFFEYLIAPITVGVIIALFNYWLNNSEK
ncbi:type I toxin-antitoxin system Fst family toxin [Salinicoccus albus]|nr:type I toxin-antitoxin system Fst family toxin [Salinicoccus albus]